MSDTRKPLSSYLAPRYWPTWFGLGLLRVICAMPTAFALAVGRITGRIAHRVGSTRRAIVRRNLELCFPELPTHERNKLALKHFEALGMSLIEMGFGRWCSDRRARALSQIEGYEHLERAAADGKGVILLGAHFTTLEFSGRALCLSEHKIDAVYRKNRSDFVTEFQRSGRERSVDATIEKRNIKHMVRSLKSGRVVWYAPDQSYSRKGAEVLPFFGVPCMQTTATASLARLGDAKVLPFFSRRLDNNRYQMTIGAPFDNFPSDDPVADTLQYVSALEDYIRLCPEQYFWIHRKFKNLPPDYPDYYADLDALK